MNNIINPYLYRQTQLNNSVLDEKFTPENHILYVEALRYLNNSQNLSEILTFYEEYIKFSDTKISQMADVVRNLKCDNSEHRRSLSTGIFTGEAHTLIDKNIAIYLSIIWNFNENPIKLDEVDKNGKIINQKNDLLNQIAQKVYELTTLQELNFFKHLTNCIKNWYELGRALFVVEKENNEIYFKNFDIPNFEFRKNRFGQVVEIITIEDIVNPLMDISAVSSFRRNIRRRYTQYKNVALTMDGVRFSSSNFWEKPLDEVISKTAWVKTCFTTTIDPNKYDIHCEDERLDYCPVFFLENAVPKGLEALQTIALTHNVMQKFVNLASEISSPIVLIDPSVNVEPLKGSHTWAGANKVLKVESDVPMDRTLGSFFERIPLQVNTVPIAELMTLLSGHLRQILDPNEMVESKGTARMTKTETLLRSSNDGLNFIGETHYLTSFFLIPMIKTIVKFCFGFWKSTKTDGAGNTIKDKLPLYKVTINNQKTMAVISESIEKGRGVLDITNQAVVVAQNSQGVIDPTKMLTDIANQAGVDLFSTDGNQGQPQQSQGGAVTGALNQLAQSRVKKNVLAS